MKDKYVKLKRKWRKAPRAYHGTLIFMMNADQAKPGSKFYRDVQDKQDENHKITKATIFLV